MRLLNFDPTEIRQKQYLIIMLTQNQLEQFALQAIAVAGKSAQSTHAAIERFIGSAESQYGPQTPFCHVLQLEADGNLLAAVCASKMGNNKKNAKAFLEIARSGINLRTCSNHELEALYGIGKKTSRFFLLYTRPDAQHVVLDVHILKWLRDIGHDAPASTPSNSLEYDKWSTVFALEADKLKMTIKELDRTVWNQYSTGKDVARDSLDNGNV